MKDHPGEELVHVAHRPRVKIKYLLVKKWTVLKDGSFCLPNLDIKTTLTFFGTYNANSAINFAKNQLELTREGPLI